MRDWVLELSKWAENFSSSYRSPGVLVITMASCIHFYEALVLIFTSSADSSVGISAMLSALPQCIWISQDHLLAISLIVAVALSVYATHNLAIHHIAAFVLLLPQQTFLTIAAMGAFVDIFRGHYADGYIPIVPHPSVFISVDQIGRILLAPFYTWAMFKLWLWFPDDASRT